MNRKYFIGAAAAVVIFCLAGLWTVVFSQDKKVSQDKAAVVNGAVISKKLLERELDQVRQKLAGRGKQLTDAELAAVRKDLLEGLINRELILQESGRQKITVTDAEVQAQFEGLKRRFPGESEFKEAIQAMDTSEAEVKRQIRQEMELKRFIDQSYADKISVPEQEVRAYYAAHPDFFKQPEKIRASHILIKVDPQADPAQKAEARQQLEQIQQKLAAGEDFGSLAKSYSQGPSSSRNGDLGFFGRGQMVKPFEDAAFALKPGEVSDIVETDFGYHLIKVFEKKAETVATFEQAKGKIEQYLKQDKIRKEVSELVAKLKKNAVIERLM